MCRRFLALLLFAGVAGFGADRVDPTTQFPDPVGAGQTVTIHGEFAADPKPSNALIVPVAAKEPLKREPVKPAADNKAVTFILPSDLTAGRYYVQLEYKDQSKELVPGGIRVVPNPITLDSAHPTTAYRNPATGLFDFDIVGQNFSPELTSNQVYVTGQGGIIKSWHNTEQECKVEKEKLPCLWADQKEVQEKLHVMGYKAERYQGPLALSVGVGGVRSTEKNLNLSRMSETGVLIWSAVIFTVLAYIIYHLVSRGVRDYTIGGTKYSPLFAFFIDKQSNSYSLSKFQLFLFSAVFVFGYLYVFLCRWLVQWQFILPDVPSNLAGLLGISAGTTIVAAGATAARGSKGAGTLLPSAADLISTGGMVVPERFQFFVWTLVACFGFVVLLISQNPATITGFPTFPDGLLYVMGVSSAGYLGGKLVRKPGPVIHSVAWDKPHSVLIVQGENLSSEGDFFIDEHKLPIVTKIPPTQAGTAPPPNPAAADAEASRKLITPTRQDQASDSTFCSELKIEIITKESGVDLSAGEHVFRIVNKDGQFADVRFTADPPEIKSVTMAEAGVPNAADADKKQIKSGKSDVTVLVIGSGFRMGMTARWRPVGAQDLVELTPAAIKVDTQTSLKLTLTPGDPGPAVLFLQTPSGFSVTTTVTVV